VLKYHLVIGSVNLDAVILIIGSFVDTSDLDGCNASGQVLEHNLLTHSVYLDAVTFSIDTSVDTSALYGNRKELSFLLIRHFWPSAKASLGNLQCSKLAFLLLIPLCNQ